MSKSRVERMRDDIDLAEEQLEALDRIHSNVIEAENELLWALYTSLDVSQSDALEIVDPSVDISQSTASRIIRDEADRVIVEGPNTLGMPPDGAEFESEAATERRREVLAEAILDVEAISKISSEHDTPDWAAERHPDLVNGE